MRPTVAKLVDMWSRRAAVRSDYNFNELDWHANKPDYPVELLPFCEHPEFKCLVEETRTKVLALAWLYFNFGAISVEDIVVNPALSLISSIRDRRMDDVSIRVAVQQMLVDEHFHSLMHVQAMDISIRMRGIDPGSMGFQLPRPFLELLELRDHSPDKTARDALTLAWAVVTEIRIPAYLAQLTDNTDIQPLHRLVPSLHYRDEMAHCSIFAEICKFLYIQMSGREQKAFTRALSKALSSFLAPDYSAWVSILDVAGVVGSVGIVRDCEVDPTSKLPARDLSQLKAFAADLNIEGEIDYCFG